MSTLGALRRNSLFFYITDLVPRLVSLFIVPIWSARVPPSEYARWVLSLTSIEVVLSISTLGLVDFMVKVLYRYHDDRVNKYFALALKVILVSTAVLALLMIGFSPFLSRTMVGFNVRSDLFAFLAIYLVFAQLNNQTIIYIQTRIQYGLSFILLLTRWALNITLLLYCLLVQHQGFYSWVWAAIVTEIMVSPISLYFLREVKWGYFNKRMLSFAFRFSLPGLGTQVLSLGQTRLGRYVLSFSGLGSSVGLLGVAQSFSQNYGGMVRPAKLVAQNIIGHRLEEDAESPHFLEFFHAFWYVGLTLAFLGAMFFQDIMKLFIAPAYWEARAALPALVFGLYMEEMFTIYHSLMFRYFKVWFDFSRTLLAFPIVAIATLVLVPRFGFIGAALAQSIGSLTMWLYAQTYAMKIAKRAFLFREKILFTVFAFCLSELAYVRHLSFGSRVALAFTVLVPYAIFCWKRRAEQFPILAARLGLLKNQPLQPDAPARLCAKEVGHASR